MSRPLTFVVASFLFITGCNSGGGASDGGVDQQTGGDGGSSTGGAAGASRGGSSGSAAGTGGSSAGSGGLPTGGTAGSAAGAGGSLAGRGGSPTGGVAGSAAGAGGGVVGGGGSTMTCSEGPFGWGGGLVAAFSPDATLVAIASPSSHLEVRRWSDDTLLAGITNGIYGVRALAFSGDGKLLAGAAADGVKLWSLVNGSLTTTIPDLAGATMLALSYTGDVVGAGFTGNPGTAVKVWNQIAPTSVVTLPGISSTLYGVAVTPDGAGVAATYGKVQGMTVHGHITLWPSAGGTPVWDHDDGFTTFGRIVVSADGKMLAVGSGSPASGNLYSTADASLIRQVSGLADPWAFSSDGAALVGTSKGGTVPGSPSIFHVSDGALAKSFPTPSGTPLALGVGPSYAVRSLDLRPETGFGLVENGVSVSSQSGTFSSTARYVAISASGHLVATAPETGTYVTMWNADTLKATGVTYAGVGPLVLTSGGTLVHASGTTLYFEGGRPAISATATILALALSPSEQSLAVGNDDNTATLRDATTGAVLSNLWTFNDGHTGPIRAVAFSRDGVTIATGSDDGTIKLWAAATGTFIRTLTGALGTINSISFTSDGGRILSADGNGDLRLWRVSDGTSISMTHLASPYNMSALLSADDAVAYVATATLKRLHLPDWGALPDIPGHAASIDALALSGDGKRLVSGSGILNGGDAAGAARLDCLP